MLMKGWLEPHCPRRSSGASLAPHVHRATRGAAWALPPVPHVQHATWVPAMRHVLTGAKTEAPGEARRRSSMCNASAVASRTRDPTAKAVTTRPVLGGRHLPMLSASTWAPSGRPRRRKTAAPSAVTCTAASS